MARAHLKTDGWMDGVQRRPGIDALRGLAVLLMITQHVAYWFGVLRAKQVILVTGALGGLAAPIFITLSGVGVAFSIHRHAEHCDRLLILRGALLVGFGFLMNLLTPSWFSPLSWYVLHLIGTAMILSPLLRRASDPWVLVLIGLCLIATVSVQNLLDTPLRLFNEDMAAPQKPGGVLRFALAEGFFPLLPWLAFFMTGLLAGRWLLAARKDKIVRLALAMLGLLVLLAAVDYLKLDFARQAPWLRFFRVNTTFYPALTPITLFLMAVSLCFLLAFVALEQKIDRFANGALTALGRASLTILIVHVALFRESLPLLGLFHRLSPTATVLATLAVLLGFTLAALAWRKTGFKYGAEWVLRRLS
ncbi:MAG: DUF418 domain-containing transporter [Desulfobacterales bacterium]|nr:DUF418 domain-containing transporter [Desulfobacterales bacterium]